MEFRSAYARLRTCSLLLATCSLFSGCIFTRMDRQTLEEPVTSRAIEVESGDRFYVLLDENLTTGYGWEAKSEEGDGRHSVWFEIKHLPPEEVEGICGAPGKAQIEIRVNNGFQGPATVTLDYRRPWEDEPIREINLLLWHREGDVAPWRD